jgi:hypothetical protein
MPDLNPNRHLSGAKGGQFAEKHQSEATNVKLAGGPADGGLGDVLKGRFEAAKELHEAHAQNEWVESVRAKHPEAAYAYPVVRAGRGNTSIRRIALHDADGADITVSAEDSDALTDAFDKSWDMSRHITPDTNKIFVPDIGVFNLDSVENRWNDLEGQAAASLDSDPFAHLSGMEKAARQSEYAQTINHEATAAYVEDLSEKIRAVNPDAARLYVNRKTDVEYGLTFSLDRVEDVQRNYVDVDLMDLEQHAFQDIHLDTHVDYEDATGQLYIHLNRGD